jgi:hypothetical protein
MRYANNAELSQFHDAFLAMCEKHAVAKDEDEWGYPHGVTYCDTFSFNTKHGTMYIGHDDLTEKNRWWIPIGLEEQIVWDYLSISFEMCIPKTRNMRVSIHYALDDNNIVHILHKGKFTVGHGSVSMDDFFNYYRRNPGRWQVISFNYQDYLELGKVSLVINYAEFLDLLESLAEFANYIAGFKDNYR